MTTPAVVIRPILSPSASVNHRLPSGPAVMASGPEPGVTGNSVMKPEGVIFPIRLLVSVNQRLPSGPATIPKAPRAPGRGIGNSEMVWLDAAAAESRQPAATHKMRFFIADLPSARGAVF